jgi:hypothetical protein
VTTNGWRAFSDADIADLGEQGVNEQEEHERVVQCSGCSGQVKIRAVPLSDCEARVAGSCDACDYDQGWRVTIIPSGPSAGIWVGFDDA